MDQTHCFICEKTNHRPEIELVAIATFPQLSFAKNALFAIEKSHIIPSHIIVFSKEEIEEFNCGKNQFLETETVVMKLHGIKDIVHLQLLYIESLCKDNRAITFDTVFKDPFISLEKSN